MMSIVKFMAQTIIEQSERPVWLEKRTDHRHTLMTPTECRPESPKAASTRKAKESFRVKEMASHMLQNLAHEVGNL